MSLVPVTGRNFIPYKGSYIPRAVVRFIQKYWTQVSTQIEYRQEGGSWQPIEGYARMIPDVDMVVHTVVLDGLNADTIYEYRVSGDAEKIATYLCLKPNGNAASSMVIHWVTPTPRNDNGYPSPGTNATVYKFRTVPDSLSTRNLNLGEISDYNKNGSLVTSETRFPDVYERLGMNNENMDAMMFMGDFGDEDSDPDKIFYWEDFFVEHNKRMIKSDGRVIPYIPCVGNHEVAGGFYKQIYKYASRILGDSFIFNSFFSEFRNYAFFDLGDDVTVIVMDAMHTTGTNNIIAASATKWLFDTLEEKKNKKHIIYGQHAGIFNTVYSNTFPMHRNMRNVWYPELSKVGAINLLFHGHDHSFSISKPIHYLEVSVDVAVSSIEVKCENHGIDNGAAAGWRATTPPTGLSDTINDTEPHYYIHVIDTNTLTLHSSEPEAILGDNPISFSDNGDGIQAIHVIHEDGIVNCGGGGASDFRPVWNPNTTFYLDINALESNQYKTAQSGVVDSLDGQQAYEGDDDIVSLTNRLGHFFLIEVSQTQIEAKAINILGDELGRVTREI